MIKIIFCLLFISATAQAAKLTSKNGQFFAECKIESNTENCFVDTGAFTARIRALGIIAKYPTLGKTKSKGISGEVLESHLVKVDTIAVDDLKQRRTVIATLPQEFPYSVLGIEFFKSFGKVIFDFDKLQIKKGLLKKKNLCPSPMNLLNQLIQLEVKLAGKTMFAAFDTGASLTVVNKNLVEANPGLFTYLRDIPSGADANGKKVAVKVYRLKALGLCGLDYQDVDVVAIDMSGAKKDTPEFPDIFLGANLMVGNSWAFDFGKKRWYLE